MNENDRVLSNAAHTIKQTNWPKNRYTTSRTRKQFYYQEQISKIQIYPEIVGFVHKETVYF